MRYSEKALGCASSNESLLSTNIATSDLFFYFFLLLYFCTSFFYFIFLHFSVLQTLRPSLAAPSKNFPLAPLPPITLMLRELLLILFLQEFPPGHHKRHGVWCVLWGVLGVQQHCRIRGGSKQVSIPYKARFISVCKTPLAEPIQSPFASIFML